MEEKDKLEKEEEVNNTETVENPKEEAQMASGDASGGDNTSESGEDNEDKLAKENAELKDKYVRLYSEFENYRRRTAKERLDLIKTASEDVLKELLPVLDDFERAFKAEGDGVEEKKASEGSRLIYNKMVKILASKGLEPMDGLVGKEFDAEYHEAITQIPAPSEELKGKIVDVVEKGYTLGDKVVRYAKVVIGN
jgi:molecular chaperone GrpE